MKDLLTLNPDQLLESAIRKGFPKGHVLIFLVETLPVKNKIIRTLTEHGMVHRPVYKKGQKRGTNSRLKRTFKNTPFPRRKNHSSPSRGLVIRAGWPRGLSFGNGNSETGLSYTGDRKQIQPVDITEIVGAFREEPIYELTTVLGERKLKEGLRKT